MRGKGKSGATTAAKENAVNTVAKKAESTIEAVAEKAKEAVKKVEVKEEAVKETFAETKAEVKAEVKAAEKAVEKAAFYNGKYYISPDKHGHNEGVWKIEKEIKDLGDRKARLGT